MPGAWQCSNSLGANVGSLCWLCVSVRSQVWARYRRGSLPCGKDYKPQFWGTVLHQIQMQGPCRYSHGIPEGYLKCLRSEASGRWLEVQFGGDELPVQPHHRVLCPVVDRAIATQYTSKSLLMLYVFFAPKGRCVSRSITVAASAGQRRPCQVPR